MTVRAFAVRNVPGVMPGQRETKAWIRAIADYLDLSPSALAIRAGVAASTLTRYLNDPTGVAGVSQKTLDAIAALSGIPVHQMPNGRAHGFSEPEATPYDFAETERGFDAAIRLLCQERNGRVPWEMRSWGLDGRGIVPGDVLLLDLNRKPKSGDIVCAQVYDWSGAGTQTVFRIFDPPFLVMNTTKIDPDKPRVVDDENVVIKGTVFSVLRDMGDERKAR